MGVLETVARIQHLGLGPHFEAKVAALRASFELRTGAFSSEDAWFEERSRAFWSDAVTAGRFGRHVEGELGAAERAWLGPLERAHRGLFRAAKGNLLIDAWSGAELLVTALDDQSRAELRASSGQLFDGRVVAREEPWTVALLPGAVFHAASATVPIGLVIASARARSLSTVETLDALLRMDRTLRSLSRVKAAFAYRPEALSPRPPAPQRDAKPIPTPGERRRGTFRPYDGER
jgi:hypothetical protein